MPTAAFSAGVPNRYPYCLAVDEARNVVTNRLRCFDGPPGTTKETTHPRRRDDLVDRRFLGDVTVGARNAIRTRA